MIPSLLLGHNMPTVLHLSFVLRLLYTYINTLFGESIVGCGGFVKPSAYFGKSLQSSIDFTQIVVKMSTPEGVHVFDVSCAPTGYFFLPVSYSGQFTLTVVDTSNRFSFSPASKTVTVSSTSCNNDEDVIFTISGLGFSGSVTEQEGTTVSNRENVTIKLYRDLEHTQTPLAQIVTDSTGFTFQNLPPNKYVLVAEAPQLFIEPNQVSIDLNQPKLPDLSGCFKVVGYDISGSVSNTILPSVPIKVSLYPLEKNQKLTETSIVGKKPTQTITVPATGQFSFQNVPSGRWLIAPSNDKQDTDVIAQFSPTSQEIDTSTHIQTIAQPFTVASFKRILHTQSHTGEPLKDVTVTPQTKEGSSILSIFRRSSQSSSTQSASQQSDELIVSDSRGSFEVVCGPTNSSTVFSLSKQGYEFSTVQPCLSPSSDKTVLTPNKLLVRGSVSISDSKVAHQILVTEPNFQETTTTDPQTGIFEIYLAPGEYKFTVVLSKDEKEKGIRLEQSEQIVKVTNKPIGLGDDMITFSEASFTIAGSLEVGSELEKLLKSSEKHDSLLSSITVTLSTGTDARSQKILKRTQLKADRTFSFPYTSTGSVHVTISSQQLSFDKSTQTLTITPALLDSMTSISTKDASLSIPPFKQTGFIFTLQSPVELKTLTIRPAQGSSSEPVIVQNIPCCAPHSVVLPTPSTYSVSIPSEQFDNAIVFTDLDSAQLTFGKLLVIPAPLHNVTGKVHMARPSVSVPFPTQIPLTFTTRLATDAAEAKGEQTIVVARPIGEITPNTLSLKYQFSFLARQNSVISFDFEDANPDTTQQPLGTVKTDPSNPAALIKELGFDAKSPLYVFRTTPFSVNASSATHHSRLASPISISQTIHAELADLVAGRIITPSLSEDSDALVPLAGVRVCLKRNEQHQTAQKPVFSFRRRTAQQTEDEEKAEKEEEKKNEDAGCLTSTEKGWFAFYPVWHQNSNTPLLSNDDQELHLTTHRENTLVFEKEGYGFGSDFEQGGENGIVTAQARRLITLSIITERDDIAQSAKDKSFPNVLISASSSSGFRANQRTEQDSSSPTRGRVVLNRLPAESVYVQSISKEFDCTPPTQLVDLTHSHSDASPPSITLKCRKVLFDAVGAIKTSSDASLFQSATNYNLSSIQIKVYQLEAGQSASNLESFESVVPVFETQVEKDGTFALRGLRKNTRFAVIPSVIIPNITLTDAEKKLKEKNNSRNKKKELLTQDDDLASSILFSPPSLTFTMPDSGDFVPSAAHPLAFSLHSSTATTTSQVSVNLVAPGTSPKDADSQSNRIALLNSLRDSSLVVECTPLRPITPRVDTNDADKQRTMRMADDEIRRGPINILSDLTTVPVVLDGMRQGDYECRAKIDKSNPSSRLSMHSSTATICVRPESVVGEPSTRNCHPHASISASLSLHTGSSTPGSSVQSASAINFIQKKQRVTKSFDLQALLKTLPRFALIIVVCSLISVILIGFAGVDVLRPVTVLRGRIIRLVKGY
ncbi:putative Nodal modulator 2 [Blattamonas nauphoetae]|uniref:Nodal modulator 2 n=1 Tax=Blattamonas nauphoetae TaxID=2049346 RepID=A0ABQ9XXT7_9EUKA|nr:putative Nodal modulator 2 [Blattamonas nauphoetae]